MTSHQTAPTGPSAHLVDGWTDLWNGDLARAAEICTEDVTIRFGGQAIGADGDRVHTAEALAELVGAFRAPRPGLTYRVVEAHTAGDFGWCVWDASVGGRSVGGIDTFTFRDGGIARVWSVTGERSMAG